MITTRAYIALVSGEPFAALYNTMGFAVRVRSTGQKYGPTATCHQRDRADVTEFVTLVRLSSLGQHVGVLALTGYKRRKSALTAGPITHILYSAHIQGSRRITILIRSVHTFTLHHSLGDANDHHSLGWPCLAITIYHLGVNVGDTESGHSQGACRRYVDCMNSVSVKSVQVSF